MSLGMGKFSLTVEQLKYELNKMKSISAKLRFQVNPLKALRFLLADVHLSSYATIAEPCQDNTYDRCTKQKFCISVEF